MRCAAAYVPHAERYAEDKISVAVRRVDRRSDEGGPLMQPLRRIDLASSMFGWRDRCSRGAVGCVAPLPRAGRYKRWTRLGEVLVVQLTKLSALPLFGDPWIGRSVARASSAESFTSLLLALRFMRCNHRRPQATARMEVLEVPFEVLSGMIGGPS